MPVNMGSKNDDAQTYAIIGAAQAVHTELGAGFLEAVYQEALAIELSNLEIPFVLRAELTVSYKGCQLKNRYRADFICCNDIIIEIKALSVIGGNEYAQLINYLKATNFIRGLILNFAAQSLQVKRIAN